MNLKQIANAYRYIGELSEVVLPYQTTRELLRLKKRITEEFETVLTMEKALVSECGGVANKDGSYRFGGQQAAEEFAAEYEIMMNQAQDIKLPSVDLSKHINQIRISAAAMEALDGIVIFDKGDGSDG